MSAALPGLFGLNSGMWQPPEPPVSRSFTTDRQGLGCEVAFLLIGIADALLVFFELGWSKVFAKRSSRKIECGMPMGCRFFIARMTSRSLNTLLPTILMSPDFDLGAFVHVENDFEGGGRDLADLGVDCGELAAALGEEFLQDDRGALDLVGVVLRFDRQADLALLEAVENFRDGDRFGAFVLDGADDAALGDDEAHDDAGRCRARFRDGCRRSGRCSTGP